jgi:hypothetical protein
MRELNYNNAAETIRLAYPHSWDPADITGLTLTINDRSGNELASAAPATLWTSTTLDGAVSAYATSLTLDAGADDLEPDDLIMLVGAGGKEIQTVRGYDSATKIVTLDSVLRNGYSDGDAVYGMFATIEVDLSDTDVFPAGKELVLIWTPIGTGAPFTETGAISKYRQIDSAGFEGLFRDLYPRAHLGLTQPRNRLSSVLRIAKQEIKTRLLAKDPTFDITKIRDQDLLKPSLMASCAVIWARDGDHVLEDERKEYKDVLLTAIETLAALPIWIDPDEDNIQDTGEISAHPPIFMAGY